MADRPNQSSDPSQWVNGPYVSAAELHEEFFARTEISSTALDDYKALENKYMKYLHDLPAHPAWVRL